MGLSQSHMFIKCNKGHMDKITKKVKYLVKKGGHSLDLVTKLGGEKSKHRSCYILLPICNSDS